jgi:hypothetical protein
MALFALALLPPVRLPHDEQLPLSLVLFPFDDPLVDPARQELISLLHMLVSVYALQLLQVHIVLPDLMKMGGSRVYQGPVFAHLVTSAVGDRKQEVGDVGTAGVDTEAADVGNPYLGAGEGSYHKGSGVVGMMEGRVRTDTGDNPDL